MNRALFTLCQCGAAPGERHDRRCPYPCYAATEEAFVAAWDRARIAKAEAETRPLDLFNDASVCPACGIGGFACQHFD